MTNHHVNCPVCGNINRKSFSECTVCSWELDNSEIHLGSPSEIKLEEFNKAIDLPPIVVPVAMLHQQAENVKWLAGKLLVLVVGNQAKSVA